MDTVTIAGSAQLMKTAQTQQIMSTTLIKKAAEQQNQLASMLAQSAEQMPQPNSEYTFSTYV